MNTNLTDDKIADAAVKIVLASLPYKRELMEQMGKLDLPILLTDGSIYGHSPDNAAVFTKYGAEWTGLAAGNNCFGSFTAASCSKNVPFAVLAISQA